MKKLKKLTLKKEIITDLCKGEMNDLKGGVTGGLDALSRAMGCYDNGGYNTKPPRCCEYGCCETKGC